MVAAQRSSSATARRRRRSGSTTARRRRRSGDGDAALSQSKDADEVLTGVHDVTLALEAGGTLALSQSKDADDVPTGVHESSTSSSGGGAGRKATCSKKGKALTKRVGGLHVCKRSGPKATRKR